MITLGSRFKARPPTRVACPHGTCQLTLEPYSAVLLTLR